MAIVRIRTRLAETGQYPPLCMLCGENPPVVKSEENVVTRWTDPVRTTLGCLFGWIGLIYLAICYARASRAKVYLVMCDHCQAGRKKATWGPVLGIATCLAVWFVGGPALFKVKFMDEAWAFVLIFLGGPILACLLSWWIGRKYSVTCTEVGPTYVCLNLPNSKYADAYEAYMQETGADKVSLPGPVCANCQTTHLEGACFCQKCGVRLVCNCGRPSQPTDAFCVGCGQKF